MKKALKIKLEKIVDSTVKVLKSQNRTYRQIIIHNSDVEKRNYLDNLFLNHPYIMKKKIRSKSVSFYRGIELKKGEYLIDVDGCLANPTITS